MACKGCKGNPAPADGYFGRPRTHRNGSLEFPKKGPEPPPDMEGYTRDPGNDWLFNRKWPDCQYRMDSVMLTQCGSNKIFAICVHDDAPNGKQNEIKLSTCLSCPLRQ